jgi:hypothetical protein
MRSLLSSLDYADRDDDVVGTPDPLLVNAPAVLREIDPAHPPARRVVLA